MNRLTNPGLACVSLAPEHGVSMNSEKLSVQFGASSFDQSFFSFSLSALRPMADVFTVSSSIGLKRLQCL